MRVKDVLAVEGFGGFFWDDQAAIKKGIKKNGFTYFGKPITPGFYAIRQPSEVISILLLLDDGQIAHGDCCSVQYSARSGRDAIFRSAKYMGFIQKEIIPILRGIEITNFKEIAEWFDSAKIKGKNIHKGIKYGVTQALIDAVAKSKKKTMAEVISEEFNTHIATEPIAIFSQTGDDWHTAVDRAILRRSGVFPHALINSSERFEKLADHIQWTRRRIKELAGEKYKPYLHYDVYGTLGMKYKNDISKMVKHLKMWEEIAKPYKLIIEEPFDTGSKVSTMEMMHKLIKANKEAKVDVLICADEWCNTLMDIQDFVDFETADMIQIKNPDLGAINNIIQAVLYCKSHGVRAYLGGSCCETEQSAKITAHIGLATQPDQMLAKPGMGVDESYQIAMNEMRITLALIKYRQNKEE